MNDYNSYSAATRRNAAAAVRACAEIARENAFCGQLEFVDVASLLEQIANELYSEDSE